MKKLPKINTAKLLKAALPRCQLCLPPIIFAENMVKCTEITTGEDLGVTGFWSWKTSEEDAKTKTSERSESNLIKRRSMYE